MNTNRIRISGRLELVPRGMAIITDAGDHWVLEDFDPSNDDIGFDVTAEGDLRLQDNSGGQYVGLEHQVPV